MPFRVRWGLGQGVVVSLKSSAFTAFFEEVVCRVTPDTVNIVRDIIDKQRAVREKCAKKLYNIGYSSQCEFDFFAALDCILDEHFKSLKVQIPGCKAAMKSFSVLMAIITHRCPKLEDLEVDFFVDENETFKKTDDELYTIPPGSLLPRLTSLTLNFFESSNTTKQGYGALQYQIGEPRDSLLSIVGKLCPVLTTLKIVGVSPYQTHIAALICNAEMANILFNEHRQWMPPSVFSGLWIPCEFLNPLCLTLKELTIMKRHDDLPNTLCFALRHLPKLENLDAEGVIPMEAVKLLYTLRGFEQKPFQGSWRGAANRLGLDVDASSTFTFFSGKSSLKKLNYVPLDDPSSLLAVLEVCPSISYVSFVMYGGPSSSSHLSSEIILKAWPNIEAMELNCFINPQFLLMVLEIFGPNVKKLVLSNKENIDMALLGSICTKLEQLTFFDCTFIMDDLEASSCWTPETFLPKLTFLQSVYCCLGMWGVLIENKSSLVHLSLECCHIGINAYNPSSTWSQLPQLWPQLESLEIKNFTGLTIAMVADLIPRFIKLRRISLPRSFISRVNPEKLQLAGMSMKDYLNRSKEPVSIEENYAWNRLSCLFQIV